MKKLILLSATALYLCACKKNEKMIDVNNLQKDSMKISENKMKIEPNTTTFCYENLGKDSVFLSLEDNLGTITGKLRYANSEKNPSFGDIIGSKNGDTLKLNYTFLAEGTTSEREVYFLKKDGNLIEGIGEYKTEENKKSYTNPASLKYDGNALKQADCKGFERNFEEK